MLEDESIPVGSESVAASSASAVNASESAGAGSESVEAEEIRASTNENEETPVIDVHAPHGGVHTWKDFWIHLGTIAAGLLIAISLEQSVEALHRLHERHQLEADLHEEALKNHDYAATDVEQYDRIIAWLLQLQRGVDAERATGGKATFVYPARPDGLPDSPRYAALHILATEAWTTAKESALVVLLPRDEAEIYARLSIQVDQVQETRERIRELGLRQGAFETRFSGGTYPPVFDLSRLTPQQLDEYEALLADELEGVRNGKSRLKVFAAANDYLLSGGVSEVELRKAILKANTPQ
jgi:hypothetical protein